MAAATAVPALAISVWRTAFAAVATAPAGIRPRALATLRRADLRRTALAGLLLGGHFATWVSSLKLTSVASATSLVSLEAMWVVLLSRLLGERLPTRAWWGVAVGLGGVGLVSGFDVQVSASALAGDGLALAGGALGAGYVVVGAVVRQRAATSSYTMLCYACAAVTVLVASLAFRVPLAGWPLRGWVLIAAVTVTAQLLGHSVVNLLLATVSPTVVSMALLLEPVGAALLAAVFLGQQPRLGVYGGLILVVAGLALVAAARPTGIAADSLAPFAQPVDL